MVNKKSSSIILHKWFLSREYRSSTSNCIRDVSIVKEKNERSDYTGEEQIGAKEMVRKEIGFSWGRKATELREVI